MGNPLYTDALDLAAHQGDAWRKNIRGGVLSKLAPTDPQIKVGSTDHFTFTGTPKGELSVKVLTSLAMTALLQRKPARLTRYRLLTDLVTKSSGKMKTTKLASLTA